MMNKLSLYINTPQKAIDLLAALLVFLLPISMALPNILLIPLSLVVALNFKKFTFQKFTPFLILGAGILWLIVLEIIAQRFVAEFQVISRFFLVFLTFILISQTSNRQNIEYAFLGGALVAVIGSVVNIGIGIFENPDFQLANGALVNKVLWLERPYLGFIAVLSIFICLKNAEHQRPWSHYSLALLLFVFNVYIAARLAIGLSFLLFLVFIFRSNRFKKTVKIWGGVLLGICLALTLIANENFTKRMKISGTWQETLHKFKDYEARFVIWPCAYDIIKHDMPLFSGLKSHAHVQKQLTNCYGRSISKASKRQYYVEEQFNSQNQFIGFFLLGGIIPFLLLLTVFIWTWFSPQIPFETKLIYILFFAFFIAANVLGRQLGAYLFGLFSVLYLKPNPAK